MASRLLELSVWLVCDLSHCRVLTFIMTCTFHSPYALSLISSQSLASSAIKASIGRKWAELNVWHRSDAIAIECMAFASMSIWQALPGCVLAARYCLLACVTCRLLPRLHCAVLLHAAGLLLLVLVCIVTLLLLYHVVPVCLVSVASLGS